MKMSIIFSTDNQISNHIHSCSSRCKFISQKSNTKILCSDFWVHLIRIVYFHREFRLSKSESTEITATNQIND